MKNTNKNKQTETVRGRGRPCYVIKYPQGKFSFAQLMEHNQVDRKTGKGPLCSKLTLNKGMKTDSLLGIDSIIVRLGELRKPNSEKGLGRKCFVYIRRSKLDTLKAVKVATKQRKPKAIETATAEYEATKAALLTPVLTIEPVETVIQPEPAPVIETEPIAIETAELITA